MTSCATIFFSFLMSRAIVAAAGWDICNGRTTKNVFNKKSVLEWVMESSACAQLRRTPVTGIGKRSGEREIKP